jgi:hypothetical protein
MTRVTSRRWSTASPKPRSTWCRYSLRSALGAWGSRHLPVTPELSIRARLLERGGPELWKQFMVELRHEHLGATMPPSGPTVRQRLQLAYEDELSRNGKRKVRKEPRDDIA